MKEVNHKSPSQVKNDQINQNQPQGMEIVEKSNYKILNLGNQNKIQLESQLK